MKNTNEKGKIKKMTHMKIKTIIIAILLMIINNVSATHVDGKVDLNHQKNVSIAAGIK